MYYPKKDPLKKLFIIQIINISVDVCWIKVQLEYVLDKIECWQEEALLQEDDYAVFFWLFHLKVINFLAHMLNIYH